MCVCVVEVTGHRKSFLFFKRNKSLVDGKEGNVSTTQREVHRKGRRFCCIQNSLSLPDDTEWEPANACIVPASRLQTFFPPRSNCFWIVPGRGEVLLQLSHVKGTKKSTPPSLLFLPPFPRPLSLPLCPSLHPLPPDRAHLPDLGCRRPHKDLPSACRAAHRLQPSLDLRIFVYALLHVQVRSGFPVNSSDCWKVGIVIRRADRPSQREVDGLHWWNVGITPWESAVWWFLQIIKGWCRNEAAFKWSFDSFCHILDLIIQI